MTPPPATHGHQAHIAGALARVAAEFRLELPGRMARTRELMAACLENPRDEDSLQALLFLLHSLAGTAGTLGMPAVGDAARAGEGAAQALRGKADRSAADFGALRGCLDGLADRVQEASEVQP